MERVERLAPPCSDPEELLPHPVVVEVKVEERDSSTEEEGEELPCSKEATVEVRLSEDTVKAGNALVDVRMASNNGSMTLKKKEEEERRER